MSEPEGIRLQKVLAQAGVASRRAAELMVAEGRIEVNGELVTEQGRRVDPRRDVIRVDGARHGGAPGSPAWAGIDPRHVAIAVRA